MPIFLPIASVSISSFLLIGAGMLVGFLSGLLGVGGGFLLTPILMMIGIPPTIAAASDSCQIVAASSSGVAAHFRLGNVDTKMGAVLLAGGVVGAAFGVRAIKLLRALGEADLVITLTYIVMLGTLGTYMAVESVQRLRGAVLVRKSSKAGTTQGLLDRLPWQAGFPRSQVRHSLLLPFALSALVGLLATIMGVGGGFIMLPMMVYLLGMPTHVAVGTSLFQMLFVSVGITYMQATTNHTVDLVLALLLAAGSTIGAQLGARVSRLLRGEQLLAVLASLALLVAVRMIVSIVVTPSILISPAPAHALLHTAPCASGFATERASAMWRILYG